MCTYFNKYFEKILKDKKSKELFEDRKNVDVTVLLDWHSTQDTLKGTDRLSIMKDLLTKWDPGVKHKRIAILRGGYSEWLNLYPQFVTNHDVKLPNLQENSYNEILDDFEFPSILDDEILNTNKSANKTVSFIDQKNDAIRNYSSTFEPVNKAHDAESKWRSSESQHDQKPVNPFLIENGTANRTRFKKKETSVQPKILVNNGSDIAPKPTFDRSNKPTSLVQQNTETKLLSVMEELYLVKKKYEDVDNKILNLERDWFESKLNGNKITLDIAHTKLLSHKADLKALVSLFFKYCNI